MVACRPSRWSTGRKNSGSSRSARVIARSRPTCSGCPHPVSCRPQSLLEMNAARMDRGQLFYRSPAAVGDHESGSVPGSGRRDRSVFVENLEPVELDHVLVIVLRVGIELA